MTDHCKLFFLPPETSFYLIYTKFYSNYSKQPSGFILILRAEYKLHLSGEADFFLYGPTVSAYSRNLKFIILDAFWPANLKSFPLLKNFPPFFVVKSKIFCCLTKTNGFSVKCFQILRPERKFQINFTCKENSSATNDQI